MNATTTLEPENREKTLAKEFNWQEIIRELAPDFEEAAKRHDTDDLFVSENYEALKIERFFSAAIPRELGGAGVPLSQMCELLSQLAQSCGSTALACSMHQHLLAAMIWKYRNGQGGEKALSMIAEKQPVLVSTGARDWLESNGETERVEGGYRVTAVKHFASQSSAGNILVTSAPFDDPETGARVLHFTVPFDAEGLHVDHDWRVMGMRGTGSNTVRLDNVFVSDSAVTLNRPRGEFHPFWNVVLVVALPLIMSVYVGIARKAAAIATKSAKKQRRSRPYLPSLIGALHNELITAELNWKDMIRIANDLDFKPVDSNGHQMLTRKTNVATACIGVVSKAMEIAGGQGFYRGFGLERLFRDVQAAHYHPLQEKDQHAFCGEYLLKFNEN